MNRKGTFIIIDGIDGSGKSTILSSMAQQLEKTGYKIFDAVAWTKKHNMLPCEDDFCKTDVIITAEPTHAWTGSAIRNEIISKNKRAYTPLETAHAFSLDRLVHYKRVVLPALAMGKIVLQDRGVCTSIVYQPVQHENLPLKIVLELPGNKLALKYAPDHLIITDLNPAIAMRRLSGRVSKKDNAIFDKLAYQKLIDKRYKSQWFKKMFEKRGTKIHKIDVSGTKQEMKNNALSLLSLIINKKYGKNAECRTSN
ncbi:MAG: hypothetical protein ACD_76C00161G0019 [uncultured bacterium]|nr:MAG: hypothetical protein ACD_76C00161G0019 [uncultured bacterium]HBD05398.1 hypothetical protein [Candidatus Uhrbacteria bacterium]